MEFQIFPKLFLENLGNLNCVKHPNVQQLGISLIVFTNPLVNFEIMHGTGFKVMKSHEKDMEFSFPFSVNPL